MSSIPPTLTAFTDTDGDGTADKSEVLVKGIGFDLKFRGADHTTNGIRLGIDGFIYVAVGDYGFVKAEGKDGDLAPDCSAAAIARVRTDGTGLEIVSRGQRNIYDVAIDPFMDLFTRDNTNDGDGWDVRLSHVVPTGHYGYPSLFKRFPDEHIQPLADYGGGSPCGSLYLQEPGNLPRPLRRHALHLRVGPGRDLHAPARPSNGASFQANQEMFVRDPPSHRHGRRRPGADLRLELAGRRLQLLEARHRLRDPARRQGRQGRRSSPTSRLPTAITSPRWPDIAASAVLRLAMPSVRVAPPRDRSPDGHRDLLDPAGLDPTSR